MWISRLEINQPLAISKVNNINELEETNTMVEKERESGGKERSSLTEYDEQRLF